MKTQKISAIDLGDDPIKIKMERTKKNEYIFPTALLAVTDTMQSLKDQTTPYLKLNVILRIGNAIAQEHGITINSSNVIMEIIKSRPKGAGYEYS